MPELADYVGKRVRVTLKCGVFEGVLIMHSSNAFYLEDSDSPFKSPSCMFTGDSVQEIEEIK